MIRNFIAKHILKMLVAVLGVAVLGVVVFVVPIASMRSYARGGAGTKLVTYYADEKVVRQWRATGVIETSNGLIFRELGSNKRVYLSGKFLVEELDPALAIE